MARLSFALRMAKERWNNGCARCPYGESRFSIRLQRNWPLIESRQCTQCSIIYRWSTDPADGALDFYECGCKGQQTTDIPGCAVLDQSVAQNFAFSPYDKLRHA